MNRKPPATAADYMIVAINPALIMLLVGSVLFYLCEVFYRGGYEGRLTFICAMYVMGIVSVSRISMEEGSGYAATFGAPLATVVYLAFFKFVQFHGPLAAMSPLLNAVFLLFTWWLAYKLTWDCTLLDEKADASGQGLLEAAGFDVLAESTNADQTPGANNAASSPMPAPPSAPQRPRNAAEALLAEKEKYERERLEEKSWIEKWFEPDRRQRAQGLWVIWFAAIALPIFGVMQWFVPSDDSASRVWCLQLLLVYVGSSLALLLNTSFLSLRRYLRQRGLEMPLDMASVWMIVGGVLIAGVMLFCLLLPRPGAEVAISKPPFTFGNSGLNPSKWGFGNDGQKQQGGAGQSGKQPSPSPSSGQTTQSQSSATQAQPSATQANPSPSPGQSGPNSNSQGNPPQSSSPPSNTSPTPSSNQPGQPTPSTSPPPGVSGQSPMPGAAPMPSGSNPANSPNPQSGNPPGSPPPGASGNSPGKSPGGSSGQSPGQTGGATPSGGQGAQTSPGNSPMPPNPPPSSGASPMPANPMPIGPGNPPSTPPQSNNPPPSNSGNPNQGNNPQANNTPPGSSDPNKSGQNPPSQNSPDPNQANPNQPNQNPMPNGEGKQSSPDPAKTNPNPQQPNPSRPPANQQPNQPQPNPQQPNPNQPNASPPQSNQSQPNQPNQAPASQAQPTTPPPPPPKPASSSGFKLPSLQIPGSLGNLLKLLLWGAMAVFVVYALIRYRDQLAAAFKQLLDELSKLWARLFGGDTTTRESAAMPTAKVIVPPRPFASYPNPFTTGLAGRMPPQQLLGHTLAAAEAFGRERGLPREESETPHEYLARLFESSPEAAQRALAFAETYGQVAFGRGAPVQQAQATSKQLWQVMSASPPVRPTVDAAVAGHTSQR